MRGKYLVKNRLLFAYLVVLDFLTKKTSVQTNGKIQNILLANIAHLGDVVLSTWAIDAIKQKYPQARIFFLCRKESAPFVEPFVEKCYFLEHFKMAPSKNLRVFGKWVISWMQCLYALRKQSIDLAIDLYPYYPNAACLFKQSQIPWRVGFVSSGGSKCLHQGYFASEKYSLFHLQKRLLSPLKIYPTSPNYLVAQKACPLPEGEYVLIHPCSRKEEKNIPFKIWEKIVSEYKEKNVQVLYSGKTQQEKQLCQKLSGIWGNNCCGAWSLAELAYVIQHSQKVLCVDTVAFVLADLLKKSCRLFMHKKWQNPLFAPQSPYTKVFFVEELIVSNLEEINV